MLIDDKYQDVIVEALEELRAMDTVVVGLEEDHPRVRAVDAALAAISQPAPVEWEPLRNDLADCLHTGWATWMRYMFRHGYYRNMELEDSVQAVWIMPVYTRLQLEQQMGTPHAKLPDDVKARAYGWADNVLQIVCQRPAAAVEAQEEGCDAE